MHKTLLPSHWTKSCSILHVIDDIMEAFEEPDDTIEYFPENKANI